MSRRLVGPAWNLSPQERAFDLAIASAMLPLALTLGSVGATAFFLENGCDPLFGQERVGKAGELFTAWKFRTMPFNPNTPNGDHGDASNGDADERATRVGRILRKTKIDDSLMLVNVLAGDMSMVGPRPLPRSVMQETYDLLSRSERKDWDWSREILPGEASAFYAQSRDLDPLSEEFMLKRVEYDIWYREHSSPMVDLKILADAIAGVVAQQLDI